MKSARSREAFPENALIKNLPIAFIKGVSLFVRERLLIFKENVSYFTTNAKL